VLAFVEYAKAQPGPFVFGELKPTKHGKRTAVFSGEFGKRLRKLGLTDRRLTFHSLRHTFKTACREAGITEEIHDALTGHSNGSLGRGYGVMPLRVLAEAVAKIRPAGIDTDYRGYRT
jgi:integrase